MCLEFNVCSGWIAQGRSLGWILKSMSTSFLQYHTKDTVPMAALERVQIEFFLVNPNSQYKQNSFDKVPLKQFFKSKVSISNYL